MLSLFSLKSAGGKEKEPILFTQLDVFNSNPERR